MLQSRPQGMQAPVLGLAEVMVTPPRDDRWRGEETRGWLASNRWFTGPRTTVTFGRLPTRNLAGTAQQDGVQDFSAGGLGKDRFQGGGSRNLPITRDAVRPSLQNPPVGRIEDGQPK